MKQKMRGKLRGGVAIALVVALLVLLYGADYLMSGSRTNSQNTTSNVSAEMKTVSLSLFSDVQDWSAPNWSLKEGSLTQCISQKCGVRIESQCPAQDADTQLSLMLMENKLPDIIAVSDPNMIRQLVSSGKVWNMDQFFQEYLPDAQILKDFSDKDKQAMIYRDGGWYSIPTGYVTADLVESGNAIIWNMDILHELGYTLDDVKTESQVLEVLRSARDKTGKKTPVDVKQESESQDDTQTERESEDDQSTENLIPILIDGNNMNSGSLKFLAESFGAAYVDKNGAYQDIWTLEGGREALAFTNQLLQEKILDASTLTYSTAQLAGKLKSEDVLCYIGNISRFSLPSDKWSNGGLISSDSGAQPVVESQSVGGYGWNNIFISKSCTDLADTAKFLDYMISGQVFDDYNWNVIIRDWWIFRNPAWETKSAMVSNSLAFPLGAEGVLTYDAKILIVPNQSFSEQTEFESGSRRIEELEKRAIPQIVSADGEGTFAQRYQNLLGSLKTVGLEQYQQDMSSQIRKNYQQFIEEYPQGICYTTSFAKAEEKGGADAE